MSGRQKLRRGNDGEIQNLGTHTHQQEKSLLAPMAMNFPNRPAPTSPYSVWLKPDCGIHTDLIVCPQTQ